MKALVTGATGLIGNNIAKTLVRRGHEVHALVRDEKKAEPLLPDVSLCRGDITDRASVDRAVQGMNWVFHSAGMPEQWQPDPSIFDRVNCGGTKNVLEASLDAGVERVAYTSTLDVFAAEPGGTLVESRLDPEPKHTVYERSKQAADEAAEQVRRKGQWVVHLNPCAVYGPSPVHVGLNSFFIKLMNKAAPLLPPGGMSVVFVDGVADAHVTAIEKGTSGERYLLADTFVTNDELAREIRAQSDLARVPPTGPTWLFKGLAAASEPLAKRLGFTPLVAKGQLTFLLWQVRADTSKAQRDLGFVPFPLADGVARTVRYLRDEGLVP